MFNEYGVPQCPALDALESEIRNMVNAFLDRMIEDEKIGPVELQALERHISMTATGPFTEQLLLMQSKMHKDKRHKHWLARQKELERERDEVSKIDPNHPRLASINTQLQAIARRLSD